MRLPKLQEMTTQEQGVLAGTLLLIALFAIHNWFISPHVASLRAAQRYERATRQSVQQSETVSHDLLVKRKKLEQLLAERTLLAQATFGRAEAETFFRELESLCVDTGCTLRSFNNAESQGLTGRKARDEETPVVTWSAILTIEAPYSNIVSLVDRLGANERKVWIDRLHITAVGAGTGEVVCRMVIAIDVRKEEVGNHE